ncbi:MAG: macro domain-containing protein [Elusimicrobia bacterium]|nr:macro domain-containing protein [Elusimicrobiota bacterium]
MNPALTEASFGPGVLRLMLGDITRVSADALVNAANEGLVGGGGVDGAVHRVGGPQIMKDLALYRARGGCPTGSAVITPGHALPVKWVIHAVGPIWRGFGTQEELLLEDAYQASCALAAEKSCAKVTFPSLSTGAYCFPVEKAAPVALRTVAGELAKGGSMKEAVFVLFDRGTLTAYARALSALK